MIHCGANDSGEEKEAQLPRRDLVILPLLSLLTITVCLFGAEIISRHFFASDWQDTCLIDSRTADSKHRPNCTTHLKVAEGPWVTNEYNSCGYRTMEPCGPKPAGSTRIVLIGSSGSEGLYVKYGETFAERTARDLTRILRRPVEIQNLGRTACLPICVSQEIDEALALTPDILIWATDPWDIEHLDPAQMPNRYILTEPHPAVAAREAKSSLLAKVSASVSQSYSMVAAEHFLFQNTSTYARMYLHYGDHADYLRTGFSIAWEKRFDAFEILLAEMAHKADASNVPFVLVEIPSLAQAALASENSLPAGVDPHAFSARLKQISSRQGIQFVDGLEAFRGGPEVSTLYYLADGHINQEGHLLISHALVEQLTKEDSAALLGRNAPQGQTASGQGQ